MANGVGFSSLLRPEEVAQIMGVSRQMVYKLAGAGKLPSIGIGRSLRFSADDVYSFIEACRRGVRVR